MNRFFRLRCLFAAALQIACWGTANLYAATFAIGTTSGRVFVGEVVRIDDADVWLRNQQAGVSVKRPIAWSSIALARNAAEEFTPHELRAELGRTANVAVRIDNPFLEVSQKSTGRTSNCNLPVQAKPRNNPTSLPGNGSFEASDAMVRIRPYSEVRDQSQQLTGQRLLNNERIQRWRQIKTVSLD